ncbi:hypothetical protein TeGR_g3998 [Tetraparma gracilis]|uniref:WW domain-containing protein n=1 Tax=Tetraparma gracilis TaxID=2962635 RepID=A0ABQ6MNY3_9STRA|nr:hypothetical protein TeGR_g3998 [Tetraparma gracilis]
MSLPLLLLLLPSTTPRSSPSPPKYFFVYGLPRSGAQYLSELIRSNTDPHHLQDCSLLTSPSAVGVASHHQSHAESRRPDTHHLPDLDHERPATFPRHGLVTRHSLKEMQCPVGETLFIHITKDPYAWLASVSGEQPRRSLVNQVATTKWSKDGDRYANAMAMRSAKVKAGLSLEHFRGVEHFSAVKYEDFLDGAVESLRDLLLRHAVPQNSKFKGVFHASSNFDGVLKKKEGGGGEEKKRKYLDHIGKPFERFSFYVEEKYLGYYDKTLMDTVTRGLDKSLEARVGYAVPPEHFHAKHEARVAKKKTFFGKVKSAAMKLVWWTLLPAVVILGVLAPLAVWLAHSAEAKDTVEQGDGVTEEQDERRRAEKNAREEKARATGVLRAGWFEAVDVDSGQPYYYNRATNEVLWERPVEPGAGAGKKDDDFALTESNAQEFEEAVQMVAREQARSAEEVGVITDKLRRRFRKKEREKEQQRLAVEAQVEQLRQQQEAQRAAELQRAEWERRQAWEAEQQRLRGDEYDAYMERQRSMKPELRVGGQTAEEFKQSREEKLAQEQYIREMEMY